MDVLSAYKHPLRAAREARHLSIDALADLTGLSRRTLLRAEQGRGLNPSSRRLICKVFDMSAVELGLTFRQAGSKPGHVSSRCPKTCIDALELGLLDRPTRITPAHVEAARELTQTFQRQDNRFGGGYALTVAAQYLDSTVTPLLRHGRYEDEVGHALLEVAAHLAQVVAWMAYDVQDRQSAKHYMGKALELASASGDDAFGGEILAGMSHQAVHLKNVAETIDLARSSQHVAVKVHLPALLAEAHLMEAHGHALIGNSKLCSTSLHKAELAFDRSQGIDRPGWLDYLDEGYLAARFAHCFRDLGDWRQAEEFALRALRMSDNLTRARSFNTILLATTYVESDVGQACHVGLEAVQLASHLQSGRVLQYVRDLVHRLHARGKCDAIVHRFAEQVTESLGATTWE